MLPTLTLAPWELPPDCAAPLTAPADFVFRAPWTHGVIGSPPETEIWMRVVPYREGFINYFCDSAHPRGGNWIWSLDDVYSPFSRTSTERDSMEAMMRNDPNRWLDNIMRLIHFEGTPYGFPGPHRTVIYPTGISAISYGNIEFDLVESRHLNFVRLPFPLTFIRSALAAKDRLLLLLDDEESEARFALQWLHLSPEQQHAKALRFERGNEAEVRAILRAVLHTQTDIWDRGESLLWRTRYNIKLQEHLLAERNDDLVFARHPLDWNAPALPPRLTSWKRVIWSYFLPHPSHFLLKSKMCVRESIGHSDGISTLSVEASPPTMHERLEAELLLHEWWDQKLKPLLFDTPQPH